MNAIFSVLRSGCAWRLLPHESPTWQTAYQYFRLWRPDGAREQLHHLLRDQLRTRTDAIAKCGHATQHLLGSESLAA